MSKNITTQTLHRLPLYLNYLKSLPKEKMSGHISATAISDALKLNDVQVRKDIAAVSRGGKPKVGYVASELINDIEKFLGFENNDGIIIAGIGNFGKALLSFNGFENYGLHILAGFDSNVQLEETKINNKPIFHISKLTEFCKREHVRIGIITVPENSAQEICDLMTASGITVILNFATVHLTAPEGVRIQNEDMALSLAVLSRHIV